VSSLELLEEAVHTEQHTSSRAMAKVICHRVSELLAEGQRPNSLFAALALLYHRFRDEGQVVERDAIAEVMDWFDDEDPSQTA